MRGRTSSRHIHDKPIPRFGGVAIYVTVAGVVAIHLMAMRGAMFPQHAPIFALEVLGPATLVFLIGLLDDLRSIHPYYKLNVEVIAAVLLYLNGIGISHIPLLSGHPFGQPVRLAVTILWVVMITNAFNLIDGLDGLAAGSALFSTCVVFLTSLSMGGRLIPLITIVLVGAITGLLRYNFNPASIFLGDCGSLFIGFVLSALALVSSAKAPTMVAVALPMLALGLPLVDVAVAVLRRFLSGRPIFGADREHIHHKLLSLGLSQRHAVLVLYAISAAFGLLSLLLLRDPVSNTLALVLIVVGSGLFLGLQQLRYHEISELQRVARRTLAQKRIIANNLAVRRVPESLRSCDTVADLCAVLTESFGQTGFAAFGFKLPNYPTVQDDMWMTPLVAGTNGEWVCAINQNHRSIVTWTLTFDLVSSRGEFCGHLTLHRMHGGEPLILDVNVLDHAFVTAVADCLVRVQSQLTRDHGYAMLVEHALFQSAHAND